jgi:glycyl-tRNA synthetase
LYPVDQRGKKTVKLSCEEVVKKLKLPKFYIWYLAKVQQFYLDHLKLPEAKFRFKELSEEEKAFYNKIHWDVELDLESLGGFKEVGGVHYRGDHDLSGHEKISKESHKIFFEGKKFTANILELSFGVDRNIYALIELSYRKEKDRAILSLPPNLAPLQVAVFPLVNKDSIDKKARAVFEALKEDFDAVYDDSGSIGKRYYREDERGTFLAITVDYDSLKAEDVTVRSRDTTKQTRVSIKDLKKTLLTLMK